MAETPPLRKFMFDHSFDSGGNAQQRAAERPRGPVTLKPEQVDALKKEAYEIGFVAGKKAGVEEHELWVKTTLVQLETKLGELMANIQAVYKEQDVQVRNAIMTIARKILPDFAAKEGINEINALLSDVIAEMVHEPRLVVRVHESQFDSVSAKIQEITSQKAYAGKVVVLADEGIAAGDCRVEWADGGVERNTQATWDQVEKTVAPEGAPQATPQSEELNKETTHG